MRRLGVDNWKLESELFMKQPALILVRQAMGRAIRFPDDKANFILADSRFRDRFWQEQLGFGSSMTQAARQAYRMSL